MEEASAPKMRMVDKGKINGLLGYLELETRDERGMLGVVWK
jgi:hypothetical protein